LDKNVFDIILTKIVSYSIGYPIKKGGIGMKQNNEKTSEGLNELFEIINAKGDTGELKEIVERYESENSESGSNS
jgi:hypothetical protein